MIYLIAFLVKPSNSDQHGAWDETIRALAQQPVENVLKHNESFQVLARASLERHSGKAWDHDDKIPVPHLRVKVLLFR